MQRRAGIATSAFMSSLRREVNSLMGRDFFNKDGPNRRFFGDVIYKYNIKIR